MTIIYFRQNVCTVTGENLLRSAYFHTVIYLGEQFKKSSCSKINIKVTVFKWQEESIKYFIIVKLFSIRRVEFYMNIVHMCICIYIYTYIYIFYVCICVCVGIKRSLQFSPVLPTQCLTVKIIACDQDHNLLLNYTVS